MRISVRAALIALIALVAVGGLFSTGLISTVSTDSKISQNHQTGFCKEAGVSLVIVGKNQDASISCANNFSGSGWDVFAATGQLVEGTTDYPTGFVCRINGYPSKDDQPCTTTPTSRDGGWAYYYAPVNSDKWRFSPVGASMRKPTCGEAEAWVFIESGSETAPPSIAPETFKCE